ncbi:IS3 family transposase [Actinobacillus ureae]
MTLKLRDFFGAINHKRIQVKLKGLSPVQYRTQSLN